jgi:hypothetical protein
MASRSLPRVWWVVMHDYNSFLLLRECRTYLKVFQIHHVKFLRIIKLGYKHVRYIYPGYIYGVLFLLQGDSLLVDCVYNSMGATNATYVSIHVVTSYTT